MARRRRARARIDPHKERTRALEQGVPGDPTHPLALCTRAGRTLRMLVGGALSGDTDATRAIAQAMLEGDTARESAPERWREAAERIERAAARCAGAGETAARCNTLYEALGAATREGEETRGWESAASPIALAIEAAGGGRMAQAHREAARLGRGLEEAGASRESAGAATRALEALCDELGPGTEVQKQQPRERLRMREEASEALLRQCALGANGASQRTVELDSVLRKGLEAISYEERPVEKIAELGRAARAPDASPAVAFIGTYPFDPANRIYDRRREYENTHRPAANEATRKWIDSNACVVPVLMDKHGKVIGDNASGKLFKAWAEDAGEALGEREHERARALLERCAVAGYDGKEERVTVRRIKRYPSGEVTCGALIEWLGEGRGDGTCAVEVDDPVGVDPEQWDGATPAPGAPVFVLVREQERCSPSSTATDRQAPHHIESVTKAGPGQNATVHPHALAITAAARLGGARDLWLMTGEIMLGKLFRESHRARGGAKGEKKTYEALVSMPVHRAAANVSAMGAGAVRVGVHAGAPWNTSPELERRSPDLYERQNRKKDDPLRYDAEGGRSTAIGEMEVWGETAEDRGHEIERRDILDARIRGREYPMRITCICAPESVEDIMELLAEARWDAVEVTFPEPLWRLGDTAKNAREAARKHFPGGSGRAMPKDRVEVNPTQMSATEIVVGPGSTDAMGWRKSDLVLLGDIDPTKAEHFEVMDWLAQAAREGSCTATIATTGKHNVFTKNAGWSLVWGSAQARHHAGLRGEASKESFVLAHERSAEWLLGRRHAEMNAVTIAGEGAYVELPGDNPRAAQWTEEARARGEGEDKDEWKARVAQSESEENECWEQATKALEAAASERAGEAVLAAVERRTAPIEARLVKIDPQDLTTPPVEPTMRLLRTGGGSARRSAGRQEERAQLGR